MILGYSLYELLWLFLIYAFLGWCAEVAWCGIGEGKFVNRGFLNGPVCPIYGFGAVAVILLLTPIDNIILLFVCSMLITTALEFVTGFALDKLFHTRWWDYSDIPFNIRGYVCLKYSILWGFVCVGLMRGLHPVMCKLILIIPKTLGYIQLVVFLAAFVTDTVITVVTINSLTKRIKLMDDIAEKMHSVSDDVGERIYAGVSAAVKKSGEIYNSPTACEIREKYNDGIEEIREKYNDGIEEIKEKHNDNMEELREKYAKLTKEKHVLQQRIIKAFPKMHPHNHAEQFEKLRDKLKKK